MNRPRRVAIIHEWFTSMRGGEKCVEALCELYPDAVLFALVHLPGSVSPVIEQKEIRTSFIQRLPFAATRFRHYLPLFPLAVERFDLRGFDLIISSNHCVAKGVRTGPEALHLCYCHTPMRYIWSMYDAYFGKGRAGPVTRLAMGLARPFLQRWDVRTAERPAYFIANSENVRRRIRSIYGRDAEVIYPPVEASSFGISRSDDGFFLMVSALVPYKYVDLAVEAFRRTGQKLVVVGDGPEGERLRSLGVPNVEFVGHASDGCLHDYYARCRAVLFPGEEDFGIVPVEAMAAGKPVIAFARGGALETVIETPTLRTGILFHEQTVDALLTALQKFEATSFDPAALHEFALRFDRRNFLASMKSFIENRWQEFEERSLQPHV